MKTDITLISLGSPAHYHMWNELSCETLAGDLRGFYGDKVGVKIIRVNSEEELRKALLAVQQDLPDIVGISAQPGSLEFVDSFIKAFNSMDFSTRTKPLLVLGNQIPTYYPHQLIEKYKDIIIVRGEGEESLRGLVDFAKGTGQIETIPNLVFIKDGEVIETELKTPDLEQLPYPPSADTTSEIVERGGNAMVQASRGCSWGACTYCTRKTFRHGKKWQGFPVERILANITDLVDLGITEIEFCDDEFFGGRSQYNIERTRRLAEGIEEIRKTRNIDLTFRVFTRADILYKEDGPQGNERMHQLLARLKSVGLVKVYIGIESGLPSQIRRFNRGVRFEETDGCLQMLQDLNIGIDTGFIMFDPELTIEEMMENISYFRKRNLMPHNQWPYRPLALNTGSRYYERLKGSELIVGEDMNFMLHKYIYRNPHIARIVDIINEFSSPESPNHHLFYGLKSLSKKYFDPNKRDVETKLAQQYIEEAGYVFLDLMEELGKVIRDAPDGEIERIETRAIKRLLEIAQRVSIDIEEGRISDPRGFFREQLLRLGIG